MKSRLLTFVFAFLFVPGIFSASAVAQSAKVDVASPPPDSIPSQLAAALEAKGYRVTLDDGWTASLWMGKDLKLAGNGSSEALYPELTNGEFVGVISLPKGMTDFRGQAIPAGVYSLRYQLIPQDANHMGVSPNPDFLLAIPVAADTNPSANYPFKKLVALSSKTTGAHPAVIALDQAGESGTAVLNDQKMLILTVPLGGRSSKPRNLGIVLKGQATQ